LAVNKPILFRLSAFIAERNPQAAQRVATALLPGQDKLKVFSEIGLPVWQARILGTAQICSLIAMWSYIWSAMRKLSWLGFGKAKGTSEISACSC